MSIWLAPMLAATLAWWASTGFILWRVRRPVRTYRASLAGAAIAAAVALAVLMSVRDLTSVGAAYAAFGASLAIWGALEMAFLTGACTGPRRHACDGRCGGFAHARHAFESILHHELALLAAGGVVIGLAWNAANPIGAWTFGLLWVARLSAKLNLHLGVRNTGASMLPPHLAYLGSFFRCKPMNVLFPLAILGGSAFAIACAMLALAAASTPFIVTGAALVGTLAALAVLEHAMMMLPLPVDAPWAFLRTRERLSPRDLPRAT